MKQKMAYKVKQKIIVPIIVLLIFNFVMPNYSMASVWGFLVSPVTYVFSLVGDILNDLIYVSLNNGKGDGIFPPSDDEAYVEGDSNIGSFLERNGSGIIESESDIPVRSMSTDDIQGDYGVPNIKVTPAEIFSNKIAMLDANYFNDTYKDKIGGESRSIVAALKEIVASWYNVFRLTAMVGLLSVLVYLGIRIIISSTSDNPKEQAKYKKMLQDWLVSLCLLFCLHYMMAFIMTAVEELTKVISNSDFKANSSSKDEDSKDFSIAKELYFYVQRGENKLSDLDEESANDVVQQAKDEGYVYTDSDLEDLIEAFNGKDTPNITGESIQKLSISDFKRTFSEDEIRGIVYAFTNKNLSPDGFDGYAQANYVMRAIMSLNIGNEEYSKLEDEETYNGYTINQLLTKYRKLKSNIESGEEEDYGYEGTVPADADVKDNKPVAFYTNLTGYMRFCIENKDFTPKVIAAIMYLALTFYTVYFIWIYIKRLLTITLLTMIAPLVALTYPLDKVKDSRAQAFNFWLKEYIANAILPIIHYILYSILVTSAMDLIITVPLYAIFALAFIVPAEKIVKSMFGLNAKTPPPPGGFITGAMTAKFLQNAAGFHSKKDKNTETNKNNKTKIRTNNPRGIQTSLSDFIAMSGGNTSASNQVQNDSVLQAYTSAGYGKNAQGDYYNPYTKKYEKGYDPHYDPAFNKQLKTSGAQQTTGNTTDDASTTARNLERHSDESDVGNVEKETEAIEEPGKFRRIYNNAKHMAKRRYTLPDGALATGATLLGRAGKLAAKTGIRFAGAGIGLAGGIVGGNMSDMGKGIAGGLVAGTMLSNRMFKDSSTKNSIVDFTNELFKGEEYAAERASDREFMKDENTIEYMNTYHRGMRTTEKKAYMRRMNLYKMSGAGDNLKTLDKLVKWEDEEVNKGGDRSGVQRRLIQIAKYASRVGTSDFASGKADELEGELAEQLMTVTGISEEKAHENAIDIIEKTSELKGTPVKMNLNKKLEEIRKAKEEKKKDGKKEKEKKTEEKREKAQENLEKEKTKKEKMEEKFQNSGEDDKKPENKKQEAKPEEPNNKQQERRRQRRELTKGNTNTDKNGYSRRRKNDRNKTKDTKNTNKPTTKAEAREKFESRRLNKPEDTKLNNNINKEKKQNNDVRGEGERKTRDEKNTRRDRSLNRENRRKTEIKRKPNSVRTQKKPIRLKNIDNK